VAKKSDQRRMPSATGHNVPAWQQKFLESLAEPLALLELFEFLPQVYMYVKDGESRFVRANRVVCDVVGADHEAELVGKTDFDFFPPAIATQYVAEDRQVMSSRETLRDQVWLVPGTNGVPRLYLCNKIPLFDRGGKVIGVAGVKRPYEHSGHALAGYGRLMKAVEFVTEHYGDAIEVADIAAQSGLSVSQLQREFSRLFGITPNQYIREVRVGVARHLLETSEESMASIAADCGFYDQSHLTRQFKAATGLTPRAYREQYQPKARR
jgi:AraC-like DNA-binding protein